MCYFWPRLIDGHLNKWKGKAKRKCTQEFFNSQTSDFIFSTSSLKRNAIIKFNFFIPKKYTHKKYIQWLLFHRLLVVAVDIVVHHRADERCVLKICVYIKKS